MLPGGNNVNHAATDLDLPENFGLTLQKSVEEMNDVNEIKRPGALGFSLPITPKNNVTLERFRSASIIDNLYDPLPVQTWVNHIQLDLTRLQVTEMDDRAGVAEVELSDKDQSWHELAEATKLREIDLSDFTFSVANIESNQQYNTRWEPGDDLIWCPLIDFGDGGVVLKVKEVDRSPNEITVSGHGLTVGAKVELQFLADDNAVLPEPLVNGGNYLWEVKTADKLEPVGISLTTNGNGDFYVRKNVWRVRHIRPLFSLPGLLKAAFSHIGYALQGGILSTEYIQRLWAYILAPDFYDNDGNRDLVRMLVENTIDQTMLSPDALEFDTVIEDGNSSFVPAGAYQNNATEPFKSNITLTAIFQNTSASTASINVVLYSSFAVFHETITITISPSSTETTVFEKEITLYPGEQVGFLAGAVTPPGSVIFKSGSTFEVELEEVKFILENATIDLSQLIHPDYTIMDLLKGFMHLGDFKLQTSLITKTVTVFPAEASNVHSTSVEGFWRPQTDVKDMTAKIEKGSRVVSVRDEKKPRYITLQFDTSSDTFIRENLNLPEDSPLHSRTIDLGAKYAADEPVKVSNPFFEPTAEHRAGGITVPAMWDNENYEASFKISPRILYSVGWVEQRFSEPIEFDSNPTEIHISHYFFEGTEKNNMPYASQLPGVTVWNGSLEYLPTQNVVYGSQETDLYTMFWDKARFVRATLPTFSFLVRLSLEEYLAEDFRRRWFIAYKGEGYTYRLIKLLDHETGNDDSTNAVLVPEPNSTT